MPELTGIDFPLVNRLIVRLMVPESDISRKATLYRTVLVRLQDKAIREYNEARKYLLADIINQGQHLDFVPFTDHMENCINATARLYKLLCVVKSEKESPHFPKEIRKYIENNNSSIDDIRNAIEHMDEQIQLDKIVSGNPIAIVINENHNGIKVSNYDLGFQDLAKVLEKFNEIACYLLRLKEIDK
ncbi:MAG: hypothetical protein PHF74_00800 [Dehalococcoidales bacterium]|nr:hypothetical protein [Dehalococcoidales bacterium]